ncbi:unnamed protein product [Lota lota]
MRAGLLHASHDSPKDEESSTARRCKTQPCVTSDTTEDRASRHQNPDSEPAARPPFRELRGVFRRKRYAFSLGVCGHNWVVTAERKAGGVLYR